MKTLTLIGLLLCPFAGLFAQEEEANRVILCFDNSSSMAEFGFYDLVLEALDEHAANYRFIAFGHNDKIVYYKEKDDFLPFIVRNKQFFTTNFRLLFDFLLDKTNRPWKVQRSDAGQSPSNQLLVVSDVAEIFSNPRLSLKQGDKVVLITDGVHDSQPANSVTKFTINEIKDTLSVVRSARTMGAVPIHVIQIMRPGHYSEALLDAAPQDLKAFQRYETYSPNDGDLIFSDPVKVVGLAKGAMKAVAGERGKHRFCRSNREAVKAIESILNVKTRLACDPEFSKDIRVHWAFNPPYFSGKEPFENALNGLSFCLGGIDRALTFVQDPKKASFDLDILLLKDDIYRIHLNKGLIWQDQTISDANEFAEFADLLKANIESEIGHAGPNSDLAEYAVPECSFNIVLGDPNMFGFITGANLAVVAGECNGRQPYQPEMNLVSFSDRRIRVAAPIHAKELTLTFKNDKDPADTRLKTFPILPEYFETVEKQFEIGSIGYPSFTFDFGPFLRQRHGDIVVYSDLNRFIGVVRHEDSAHNFTFYKDYYYQLYYVPPLKDDYIIKKVRRILTDRTSVDTVLSQFEYSDLERNFENWEIPLDKFLNAADVSAKNTVLGRISKSDAYLKLFLNASEILDDPSYRAAFKEVIQQTLEKVVNIPGEDPFPMITLLSDQTSGYADTLKMRYIHQYEQRTTEMENVLQLLDNPRAGFNEFLNYIEQKSGGVSKENALIFQGLLGED